jgi:hypothetical protein
LTSNLKRSLSAKPDDRRPIAEEIAALLTAFPRRDDGEADLALRISAYFDAIADAPAWAVRQARLRIIRGEVGSLDTRFAPTPPQFAETVRKLLQPLKDDLADLERLSVATAEHVPTPEEKARVAEGFAKLRASMKRSEVAA